MFQFIVEVTEPIAYELIQNVGMTVKDWLTILIPAVVSLVGFLATYFGLSKSFKDEIKKQKTNIALDKMSTIPFEALDLYETMMIPTKVEKRIREIESKRQLSKADQIKIQKLKSQISDSQDRLFEQMTNFLNTIYAYGSVDAIKIVSSMQKANYHLKPDSPQEDRFVSMAHFILLASQVKKDVTNIVINPQKWFEMKITDYEEKKKLFIPYINQVVNDLGLDEDFKIL